MILAKYEKIEHRIIQCSRQEGSGIIFFSFYNNKYAVPPPKNPVDEKDSIRGQNEYSDGEIWKIIYKLSMLSFFIWSAGIFIWSAGILV